MKRRSGRITGVGGGGGGGGVGILLSNIVIKVTSVKEATVLGSINIQQNYIIQRCQHNLYKKNDLVVFSPV